MGCNPQESLENTINTMGTPNYTTTERVYQKVPRFVPLVHWSLRLFYSRSPCLEAQALGNLPEWNIEMERWRYMNMHEDMKIWRCSSWELGSEVTWWCIHKLWKKCWETSEFEGCSKFFHLENAIFAKKKLLSPNFRELHVFLSRYMLAKIFKKNVDVWYPQIVPGVWSLVTLHSAAAVLKHLRSALRCWSLLTFIGQFWHNKSTV